MRHVLPFVFSFVTLAGLATGGSATWIGVILIFLLHPAIDFLIGESTKQSPSLNPRLADFVLYAYPAWVFIFWFCAMTLSLNQKDWEWWGSVFSTGLVMGYMGINAAHELVHRRRKISRRLGEFLLMLVNFPHWGIEHLHGHHTHVGTNKDPATARRGEWIYTYIFRSYFGGWRSALSRKALRVLVLINLQVLFNGLIFVLFGVPALRFMLAQSMVAIVLLEAVDYIEHYGLVRKILPNGQVEPFQLEHAWDSAHLATNGILLNLGHHAHHHRRAMTPFHELPTEKGNSLPFGYSTMIILSFLPPLFFWVMHPLLDQKAQKSLP